MSEHTVYTAHRPKLDALHAKRTAAFDEGVIKAIDSPEALLSALTGTMKLSEEIEARMWMTVAGEIMEAEQHGIDIGGVQYSLLDIILFVAELTDEFPVLLLVEIMIASDHTVVSLRGRPVHAGQLYNITYEGWSAMEDLKERARHHFKFGFLLLTIGEGERAAEQLRCAVFADPTSNARDLITKLVNSADEKTLTTSEGVVLTLGADGTVHADGAPLPPKTAQPSNGAPPAANPSAAAAAATRESSASATKVQEQQQQQAAPASQPPRSTPTGAPPKLVRTDTDEAGSGVSALVAVAAVVAVAAIGFAVYSRMAANRKN